MNSAVETLSPTRVKLTVEVPSAELKPYLDAAYRALAAQISVPGFRPGKVPTRLIEQRVSRAAVLEEAVNNALPELYGQALEANDVRPMGRPEVEISQMPMADDEQLVFTAELDVRPILELPDFSTLSVQVDAVDDAVIEEAAQERLTGLQQRFGSLTAVERAAEHGDFVTIDLRGAIDGTEIDNVKGVSYEIGSGSMLDGMDDALTGMSTGESKDFQAPLAGGDRAGEQADITVTLGAVKVRELPELDDDFAQLASEFDTLEELQADLRKQSEVAKSFEQGVKARDALLALLLEQIDIPVPQGLVDAEVDEHLAGESREDDDEHRAEVAEETRKSLRSRILLDTIAETRDVEVTQAELIEFLVVSAQQYGMDPNEFARVLDQENGVPALAGEVARRKALASVLEEVSITDSSGAPVDLARLVPGADEDADEDAEESASADAADEDGGPTAPAQEPAAQAQQVTVVADEAAAELEVETAQVGDSAVPQAEAAAPEKPAAKPRAKKAAAKEATPKARTQDSENDGEPKPAKKAAAKKATPKSATTSQD